MTFTTPEPGIYAGISDTDYHSDRLSLSSSGARSILEDTPASFRWHQDHNGRADNDAFDLGHAVHNLVLGEGAAMVDAGFEAWTTKAAKERRQEIRDAGDVPLRSQDYAVATAMREATLAHPIARTLFENGKAELSVYGRDDQTGEMLRARPDWTANLGGRSSLVDLKTSADSAPRPFGKSVDSYGYFMQAPWYLDLARSAGLIGPDAMFLFVVVSKAPPHLLAVYELEAEYVDLGRDLNRMAINTFHECRESGEWPGHAITIHNITAPYWRTKGNR